MLASVPVSLGLLGGLLQPRIPNQCGLGGRLGYGVMSGTITFRTTLIHLADEGCGLKGLLGLGVDRFFD